MLVSVQVDRKNAAVSGRHASFCRPSRAPSLVGQIEGSQLGKICIADALQFNLELGAKFLDAGFVKIGRGGRGRCGVICANHASDR